MKIAAIILCLYFLINCIIYILEWRGQSKAYEESVKRTSEKTGEENLTKIDFLYFLATFLLGIPITIAAFISEARKNN